MTAPLGSKRKRIAAITVLVILNLLLKACATTGNSLATAGEELEDTQLLQIKSNNSADKILPTAPQFIGSNLDDDPESHGNCTVFDLKLDYSSESYEISAPTGKEIMSVTIKSRTGCDQFSSDLNKGCYSIVGIGTANVSVTWMDNDPGCKEITHLEINYSREDSDAVQICHYDKENGYSLLTVLDSESLGYLSSHPDDIYPVPAAGCPAEETPQTVQLCHLNQDGGYEILKVKADNQLGGHADHDGDIYPIPPNGCPGKEKVTPVCHATGSTIIPFIQLPAREDNNLAGNNLHPDDLIPAPAEGCPEPQPPESVCVDYLLFHTFRDGDLEIYRLDGIEGSDNFELTNLSQGPDSEDSRPTRSWDDQWVVFESNRDGNVELYINNSSGGIPVRLTVTKSNNLNPMFLMDDIHVVYQSDRNGNWDIFKLDISTGEETQLTTNLADDSNPYASPDSEWITYQSNRSGSWDIYLLNLRTGEEIQITDQNSDEINPTWSPNGKYLAFLGDSAGYNDLWVYNILTGELILVSTEGNQAANNHSWSPGGDKIAYQSIRNGNLDIFSYDIVEDEEYRLSNFSGIDASPTWDCSGTSVSFTSARDGNLNIFYVFWKGGTQRNFTAHPATDKWPEWSPAKEQASRGK